MRLLRKSRLVAAGCVVTVSLLMHRAKARLIMSCDEKSSHGCCESDDSSSCCGGECECDCSGESGHFVRRYQTKAEMIAELEAYLGELQAETQAVEEHLKDLRK